MMWKQAGTIQTTQKAVESLIIHCFWFNIQKRKYAWLEHHSDCALDYGRCKWEKCPRRKRINTKEADRSCDTRYKCVQCSMEFRKDWYFCNDYTLGAVWNCRDFYHTKNTTEKRLMTITIASSYVIPPGVICLSLSLLLSLMSLFINCFWLYLRVIRGWSLPKNPYNL